MKIEREEGKTVGRSSINHQLMYYITGRRTGRERERNEKKENM